MSASRLLWRRALDYSLAVWRKMESRCHPLYTSSLRTTQSLQRVAEVLGVSVGLLEQMLEEASYRDLCEMLEARVREVQGTFPEFYNLRWKEAALLYAITRARRPSTIVETGVANGLSTVHFLAALAVNGRGELYSIDYPPLDPRARMGIGAYVTQELRDRWHLHLDDSLRGLRRLLDAGVVPEVFLHDSEHTYLQMRREYETVFPRLPAGALLLSDDVMQSAAFMDFAHSRERSERADWVIFGRLGILRKP